MGDHPERRGPAPRGVIVPLAAGVIAVALALLAAPASRPAATSAAGPSATGSVTAIPLVPSVVPPSISAPAAAAPLHGSLGGSADIPTADLGAMQALLDRRATAVVDRDIAGYTSTGGGAAGARSQAEALSALPLQNWSYALGEVGVPDYLDRSATQAARARWGTAYVLRTTLSYRLAGYDSTEVTTAHDVTFALDAGGWRIVSDEPVDGSKEIWDFGPLTVITGTSSLVVGLGATSPSVQTLEAYAAAEDIGVRGVTQVWGPGWQRRVLVVAPPTLKVFAELLGRDPGTYAQIAAVTTAELGSGAPVSHGDRVFVNPTAFARLGVRGRTIVLRHETTHVATRAAVLDSMPTWIEEGFADYIGYRGAGVPQSAITQELAAWVRAGYQPRALPSDEDYDGRNPHLVETYEESFLACRLIAARYGQARLVALYRAMRADNDADAADGTDTAFRHVLGESFAAFTAQWRAQVLALPRRLTVGRFRADADPARDFTPAERGREQAFHAELRPAQYAAPLVPLGVLLVLALVPLGPWWSGSAAPAGPGAAASWLPRLLAATLVVAVAVRVATLPTSALAHRVLVRHGLSTQRWSGWCVDLLRGWLLATAATFAALVVLVLLAHRWPAAWWVPAAVLAFGAVVLVSFALPVVVEPLFNRFEALADGELRASLLALARQDGRPVREVLVADASRRTTALNAYVSGIGATRRVVLYDTLLRDAAADEVRMVVAHELGHAKARDVARGTVLGAAAAAFGVVALHLVLASPWVRERVGLDGVPGVRTVAVVLATFVGLGVLTSPLQNLLSRRVERRADRHALALTRDPDTFVALQHRLATANLSELDPSPVVYGLFSTHPTGPERIASARSWAQQHGRAVR